MIQRTQVSDKAGVVLKPGMLQTAHEAEDYRRCYIVLTVTSVRLYLPRNIADRSPQVHFYHMQHSAGK